jgi:3-deoxy-manno-octulosonate cytidylyltransferase (CMP-KDO synthetase)
MKVIAVIPSHLASVRFPGKILFPIHGLPMIEHVRRRALLSKELAEVYVATCDMEIKESIESYGGKVIMTGNTHKNGTSRVAEAVRDLDCTHVVLLQGDEPLLIPDYISDLIQNIKNRPEIEAWNLTGPILSLEEADRHSFVKCLVNENNRILSCFRRNPCYGDFEKVNRFIRKILGVIAFEKNFLNVIANSSSTPFETIEFIEQMRIIENEYRIFSIPVSESLPSINEPHEADIVLEYLNSNLKQKELLKQILNVN